MLLSKSKEDDALSVEMDDSCTSSAEPSGKKMRLRMSPVFRSVHCVSCIPEGKNCVASSQALDSVWSDADHGADDSLKPLDNPTNLFRILKQFGVKVRVRFVVSAEHRWPTSRFPCLG